MNLNLQSGGASGGGSRREDGIALVITLLMLSVITFLAVAFLAMTRRDRAAATASVDVNAARSMSDAALARAQAEIVARMMSQTDWLAYDYTVSRNYISPSGFVPNDSDTTNVNYDVYYNSKLGLSPAKGGGADWAQNIANLYYDPRPPVFVVTNPAFSSNSDFRFWVDVNRNGRFETNGYIPTPTNELGDWSYYSSWNGEPEFIGVLSDPLTHHSSSNRFIGRYAYMVLPIGKTLDLNYIHNWAKGNFVNSVHLLTNNVGVGARYNTESDGFARDQGVGSWELNLAGMLDVLSPWSYETIAPANPWVYVYRPYDYTFGSANLGYAFDDAEAILHYRYSPPQRPSAPAGTWPNYILPSVEAFFGRSYTNAFYNGIDTYCAGATVTGPFVFTNADVPQKFATLPWPGSYTSNMFYDPQDLFDTNKTSRDFVTRMLQAEARTNFFDRYTFQRLLGSIGTGSSPEYGVFVYSNSINALPGLPPTWLRTKVNINYDNTAQITNANAPYVPMSTNLVSWAPINFFMNAADLLLRSQEFLIATNIFYPPGLNGNYIAQYGLAHFGVTNIPIYVSTNPTIRYNAKIHRMLQLAANIYDAANGTNRDPSLGAGTNVFYPHIYRPQFTVGSVGPINSGIYFVSITGYVEMTYSNWMTQLTTQPFRTLDLNPTNGVPRMLNDLNRGRDDNICGIPWVVGTVKGVPSFNQFSFVNSFGLTRRLEFVRPATNVAPQYMSQSYELSVSNFFGTQLWNPYSNIYPYEIFFTLSNYATISVTNTNGPAYWSTTLPVTNVVGTFQFPSNIFAFPGYTGGNKSGIVDILRTNPVAMYDSYYSESLGRAIAASTSYGPFYTYADSHEALYKNGAGTGWPIHSWTLNVTNYVLYCMWTRGPTANGPPRLLDFVNLGPFGTTLPIIATLTNGVSNGGAALPPPGGGAAGSSGLDTSRLVWNPYGANDSPGSPMSAGVLAQINIGSGVQGSSDWPGTAAVPPGQAGSYWISQENNFYNVLHAAGEGLVVQDPLAPTAILIQTSTLQANDPLVHYTLDDLNYFGFSNTVQYVRPVSPLSFRPLGFYASNNAFIQFGQRNPRYNPWGGSANNTTLFKDPGAINADAFDFPTNKFPSIGWLGRVHRGTPWQTVYFKPDSVNPNDALTWSNFWAGTYDTYPTNDWILPDLFTAVPNDNAARGLLSVNQTNDAAWAAVFSGLVVPTNAYNSWVVVPTNVYNLVDGPGGINSIRTNGFFHHIGDILRAPALMTNFLGAAGTTQNTDEIVERVPQQILGLLKVGYPQFVIYSWGQSLRPKNLYFGAGPNFNICTNYEITGEVLTRTVCHVVSDPLAVNPKLVIDSYNIEPGY